MLEAGTFDDIAATVMLHAGPLDIARARSLALSQVAVEYTGREAHAAVAPYLGLNAADAITVAQVAIGLLRQQLAPGQMVHGIVTDGGQATNVIPARTEMHYTMRANDSESLRELEGRMSDCFLAGAVATGCGHRVEATEPPYLELTPDTWLADVFRAEMVRLGRTPVAAEIEAALPLGSTDMGNVTQVMPGIHPIVGIDAEGASVHQPGFAAAAARPSADKAVIEGAIMLARTVVELAATPAERDRVTGAEGGAGHEPRRVHRGVAGRPLRRPGGLAATHPPRTPSWAGRSSRPRSSSRRSWPTRASTPRCCPAARD